MSKAKPTSISSEEVADNRELVDETYVEFKQHMEYKNIKFLGRTNGITAGYVIAKDENVEAEEAYDTRTKAVVHNPVLKKTYPEFLDREINGKVESCIAYENDIFILTERIEPGLSNDKDPSNFKPFTSEKQLRKYKRQAHQLEKAHLSARQANQAAEKYIKRNNELEERVDELERELEQARDERNRANREVSNLRATVDRIRKRAGETESQRRESEGRIKQRVSQAEERGTRRGMNDADFVREKLKDYDDLMDWMQSIQGNELNQEDRALLNEVRNKINELQREIKKLKATKTMQPGPQHPDGTIGGEAEGGEE